MTDEAGPAKRRNEYIPAPSGHLLHPSSFLLHPFNSGAVKFAHHLWSQIVQSGDHVIDATCGNGHDTLFLAQLALNPQSGSVIAFDLQPAAIQKAKALISQSLDPERLARIRWVEGCHSVWPEDVQEGTVRLIVYNLGYLPGGDKSVTTSCDTTKQSILAAMPLLMGGGVISITCYPGHEEGAHEEQLLQELASSLDTRLWCASHHRWLNRKKAPSLLLLSKL